jgi:hypothetical protein
MSLASKEQILKSNDWDHEEFDVPKWGRIRIRALSAKERLELVQTFGDGQLKNDSACEFFCRLIALSIVDENGVQVFSADADVEALKTRNWNRLHFVAEKIMQFNGLNGETEKN